MTLIEIIAEDKIPENTFLYPDLNYKDGYDSYKDNFFYLAGYPNNGSLIYESYISSGKIIEIGNYEFKHTMDTRFISSGSPICTRDANVIGIHKKGDNSKNINFGIFLGLVIDKLETEFIQEKEKILEEEKKEEKALEEFKKNEKEFEKFIEEMQKRKEEFEKKKKEIIKQNEEIKKIGEN